MRPVYWILILGAVLRFAGIGFATYHPDEHLVINHALAFGTGDLNPHVFYYPTFFLYQLFAVFAGVFAAGSLMGSFDGPASFLAWFLAEPRSLYVAARFLSALYGAATVWVVWKAAAAYAGRQSAWWAAAFYAVCYGAVRDAHFATVDTALVFFMTASLWQMMCWLEDHKVRSFYAASVLLGLAASVKYSAIGLAPCLAVAGLAAGGGSSRRILRTVVGGVLMGAAFFLTSPFVVLDWRSASGFLAELKQVNQAFQIAWTHHLFQLAEGIGWAVLAAATAGLAAGSADRLKRILLGAFILLYHVMITKAGQPFERYVLPLYPVVCLLAADAVSRGLSLFTGKRGRWLWAAVLLLGLAGGSLVHSLQADRVLSAADTREAAGDWIRAHVPSGSRLAIDVSMHAPRLFATQAQLREKMDSLERSPDGKLASLKAGRVKALAAMVPYPEPSYELYFLSEEDGSRKFLMDSPAIRRDPARLKEVRIEYLVTSHYEKRERPEFFDSILGEYELAAAFYPGRDGEELPRRFWTYLAFDGDLWKVRRPGPTVFVYRLKGAV